MKTLVLAFLCLLVTPAVAAVERSLAKSPDGQFEVILRAENDKDLGRVCMRDLGSGRVIETYTMQGYGSFKSDDLKVEWKAESDAFAVSYRGTKTTYHTDLYVRGSEAWQKLDEPPYVANILGRQGVVERGRQMNQSFAGFLEGTQFVIHCVIEPDHEQKLDASKFKGWKPSDETEWRVVLEYNNDESPNCQVVSIEEASGKKGAASKSE